MTLRLKPLCGDENRDVLALGGDTILTRQAAVFERARPMLKAFGETIEF